MSEHHAAQSAPACLDHAAAAAGPSPAFLAAVAAHREAERVLVDARRRLGPERDRDALDVEERAEDAAWYAILEVHVRTHADAVAMFAHVRAGVDVNPADCAFAMAIHLLTPFLGADTETPAVGPVPALRRPGREVSPMAWAIAGHRAAYATKLARGDYEGGDPDDTWIALNHAEFDGLNAVLAAPCADRGDAAALLAHLGAYVAAEKSGWLRDDGEPACEVAEALCRALAVALAGEAETNHPAAAVPAAHSAAPAPTYAPALVPNLKVHAVAAEAARRGLALPGLPEDRRAWARAVSPLAVSLVGPGMAAQGDDLARGMLRFAQGKAVRAGDGMVGFLAKAIADAFGIDDADGGTGRVAWAEGREEQWRSIAADPLADLSWASAPRPWSALAAVLEWVAFLDHAGPGPFLSCLPVTVTAEEMADASRYCGDTVSRAGLGEPYALAASAAARGIAAVNFGRGLTGTHAADIYALSYTAADTAYDLEVQEQMAASLARGEAERAAPAAAPEATHTASRTLN